MKKTIPASIVFFLFSKENIHAQDLHFPGYATSLLYRIETGKKKTERV
jgi:hypothetical protein